MIKIVNRIGCFFFSLLLPGVALSFVAEEESPVRCAVTYDFEAVGRFGDQLQGYCKAKLVSYLYDIPLLCKPMFYSEHLMLHETERYLNESLVKTFLRVVKIKKRHQVYIQRKKPILYVVNMHSDLNSLVGYSALRQNFFNEEVFLKELRDKIKPRSHSNFEKVYRPVDQISVAAHVRTGAGWDTQKVIQRWPIKFPSKEFYIEQIKKLATMFEGKPLYVHIFTDDQHPELLMKEFQKALTGLPITFTARCQNNAQDQNVLDDFFGMIEFDCLIRPFSSFSLLAERLGNFQVVLSPGKAHWFRGEWILDRLIVTDKRVKGKRILVS